MIDDESDSLLEKMMVFKDELLAHCTDGFFDGGELAYRGYRREFRQHAAVWHHLPSFVRNHDSLQPVLNEVRDAGFPYASRRTHIHAAFRNVIDYLESVEIDGDTGTIAEKLEGLQSAEVASLWRKALDRRIHDPEGAITAARSLLESVCKHILDDAGEVYKKSADLPDLYRQVARLMNLAPDQHEENTFRSILGGCQNIVGGLASMRNTVGDAHGQGRRPVKPMPRHADLAVNLAGSMATFLVSTWKDFESRRSLLP